MDSDSPIKNHGLSTAVLLTGCQASQKAVFQVKVTRGHLILSCETEQQIGYIHFPRINPPKLMQPLNTHAHLNAITARGSKHGKTRKIDQDLRIQNIQLIDGAVLINGRKTQPTDYHRICMEGVQ